MDIATVIQLVIAGILAPMLAELRGIRADQARHHNELKDKFHELAKDSVILSAKVDALATKIGTIDVIGVSVIQDDDREIQ